MGAEVAGEADRMAWELRWPLSASLITTQWGLPPAYAAGWGAVRPSGSCQRQRLAGAAREHSATSLCH